MSDDSKREKATFGGGCFWCVEAVFQQLDGVESVVSGYAGGEDPNPTYQSVCSGSTGHAEVVQVTFDPEVIGYEELLDVFWRAHDPTTLNRQGNDVGTQYRSAIYYHSEEQKEATQESIVKAQAHFADEIVGSFKNRLILNINNELSIAIPSNFTPKSFEQMFGRLNVHEIRNIGELVFSFCKQG